MVSLGQRWKGYDAPSSRAVAPRSSNARRVGVHQTMKGGDAIRALRLGAAAEHSHRGKLQLGMMFFMSLL